MPMRAGICWGGPLHGQKREAKGFSFETEATPAGRGFVGRVRYEFRQFAMSGGTAEWPVAVVGLWMEQDARNPTGGEVLDLLARWHGRR